MLNLSCYKTLHTLNTDSKPEQSSNPWQIMVANLLSKSLILSKKAW